MIIWDAALRWALIAAAIVLIAHSCDFDDCYTDYDGRSNIEVCK